MHAWDGGEGGGGCFQCEIRIRVMLLLVLLWSTAMHAAFKRFEMGFKWVGQEKNTFVSHAKKGISRRLILCCRFLLVKSSSTNSEVSGRRQIVFMSAWIFLLATTCISSLTYLHCMNMNNLCVSIFQAFWTNITYQLLLVQIAHNSEPRNPLIEISELHKIRRSTQFEV